MSKRLVAALATVLAIIALIPLSLARPAAAAGNTVLAALACLPAEDQVVTLVNAGDTAQDLNGWTVTSDVTFITIPISGLPPLQPGNYLRIHSGYSVIPGSYSVSGAFTDVGGANRVVWNLTGDTARLRNNFGVLVSSISCGQQQPVAPFQPAPFQPGPRVSGAGDPAAQATAAAALGVPPVQQVPPQAVVAPPPPAVVAAQPVVPVQPVGPPPVPPGQPAGIPTGPDLANLTPEQLIALLAFLPPQQVPGLILQLSPAQLQGLIALSTRLGIPLLPGALPRTGGALPLLLTGVLGGGLAAAGAFLRARRPR